MAALRRMQGRSQLFDVTPHYRYWSRFLSTPTGSAGRGSAPAITMDSGGAGTSLTRCRSGVSILLTVADT